MVKEIKMKGEIVKHTECLLKPKCKYAGRASCGKLCQGYIPTERVIKRYSDRVRVK